MMILKVAGKKLSRFNDINVNLKYDSVASTFSFVYYYDPNNIDLREFNKFGGYVDAVVEYKGKPIITGTVLNYSHAVSSEKSLSQISGYSKSGVLEDCQIPVDSYPLQANGKNLLDIARSLIRPFGLKINVSPDVNSVVNATINSTTASASQSIIGYLAEIASQRNVIISHDSSSNVLLTRARASQPPLFEIDRGGVGVTSMSLSFNGQAMHSDITVLKQASTSGGNAGQFNVTNPFVSKYRPKVSIQSSGDDVTTEQAAKRELASEISSIVLTISLSSWEYKGQLLQPNTVISVVDPDLGMPNKTKWFIEEVSFRGNQESQTCELKCVLPSVHDGSKPINVFL
jgi:prophage tail gpP-like protein